MIRINTIMDNSLKSFIKGLKESGVKSIEIKIEQEDGKELIIEEDIEEILLKEEMKEIKEKIKNIKNFNGVSKPGRPGAKSKIKYKIYKNKEYIAVVYGITNTVNYLNAKYQASLPDDTNFTASKVDGLTKCYKCDNKNRKIKNYDKYNKIEIERLN